MKMITRELVVVIVMVTGGWRGKIMKNTASDDGGLRQTVPRQMRLQASKFPVALLFQNYILVNEYYYSK